MRIWPQTVKVKSQLNLIVFLLMPAEVRLSVSREQDHDFCMSQTMTVT